MHFAREGADVAIIYLSGDADAGDARKMVESEGRRCLPIHGDFRDESFCESAIEDTVKTLGGLHALINNAADQVSKEAPEEIGSEQLRLTFETNFYPYFFLVRHALEHLGNGDVIINTGSVTSFRGSKQLIGYASTKGAIEAFTYSLAQNLIERGIRANGVAPGPIWTEKTEAIRNVHADETTGPTQ